MYDFSNWEWSGKHIGQTLLDLVGLVPGIGVVKNLDEAAGLVKNVIKNSDLAEKTAKNVLDKVDELMPALKRSMDSPSIAPLLGNVMKSSDEAAGVGKDVVKSGDEVSESVKDVNRGAKEAFTDNPFDDAGNLKSNIKYQSGEFNYNYKTDSLGRLQEFQTDDLKLTERTSRLLHNPNTPGKLPGDHAGHLAGDRFGGSSQLDNLVTQSSDINLRQYKKIENQWAKAINEGKQVKVKIGIKYNDNNTRPSKFIVNYDIDGEIFNELLIN